MNAARRNRISKVISALEALQEEINTIREEEQEAFDNMPEGLQQSERGEASEQAIQYLEDSSDLDNAIAALQEAMA